jgi:tetratricopeptide (TPR) repeat protein
MSKRYPAQGGTPMETYNNGYALSMKQVYQSFPDRADAAALYADALMLQHPWDLYDHAQNPKPWTPELVTVLEHALRISPDHPAANHYYIHAVEASAMPGRGLPSADRLGRLLPGVAHMVHMPSHIYIRTGHYEKGTRVNEQAVKGYRDYLKQFPTVENNAFLYLFHNEHLRAACGIMNGKYDYAKAASSAVREAIPYPYLSTVPPEGEYLQYMYMTPLFSDIRYGKWNRILAEPAVADSLAYAKILDEAGRCVANARLKNFAAARKNLEQLKTVLYGQEKLKVRMGAFNSAFDGGRVAEKMAEGILAEEENRLDDAARLLQEATELEATMVYDEPKDWILPPAQFLGSVLLKAGRFREAENIFRKDLNYNPNNGWSLNGLAKALAKQGKKESLTAEEKNMLSAVQKKDFNPAGPVY